MTEPNLAQIRNLNDVMEAFHAVLYFSSEVQARLAEVGMEPRSEGYVAIRSAPLGRIGPGPAAATFFNFNPALFHRFLPGAWDKADPAATLAIRAAGLQATFERVDAPADGLDELVTLVTESTDGLGFHGRPLAAGNADVPLPEQPHARAWQAVAVLREHRGDGHVAALTTAGLDPVEALVLMAGWQDRLSRRFFQGSRMWDDQAWDAAAGRLVARGLVDDDGGLTGEGRTLREDVERATDRLAAEPYLRIGATGTQRMFDLIRPIAVALAEGGAYPRPPVVPDTM